MWLFNLFKKVDINTVIDKAANGIDKLMFTNEEKNEFNKSLADGVAQFAKDTLNESTIRSQSRRVISIAITCVYLFLVLTSAVIAFFNPDISTFLFKLTNETLGTAFVSVIAFHFGGYYLSNIIGKKK